MIPLKHTALLAAITLLATAFFSCGNASDRLSDHGLKLDPAGSPQNQAAEAVDNLTPEQVAEALVAWMTGASHTHYPFAGRFTRSVMARYNGSGRTAEAMRFTSAIDSVTATLDLDSRAHALTVATAPKVLAARIAADPDSATLAEAVARSIWLRLRGSEHFPKCPQPQNR